MKANTELKRLVSRKPGPPVDNADGVIYFFALALSLAE